MVLVKESRSDLKQILTHYCLIRLNAMFNMFSSFIEKKNNDWIFH